MKDQELALRLVEALGRRGLTVATAESCTGGMVAQNLTSVAGSSKVFECGIIAYANRIKVKELGVSEETLRQHGAVSEETAAEMAQGVRRTAESDIGLSTTGIAGPSGGTPQKPVGTVHIAACMNGKLLHEKLSLLDECGNDRDLIRKAATARVLQLALRLIGEPDFQ